MLPLCVLLKRSTFSREIGSAFSYCPRKAPLNIICLCNKRHGCRKCKLLLQLLQQHSPKGQSCELLSVRHDRTCCYAGASKCTHAILRPVSSTRATDYPNHLNNSRP